MIFDNDHPSHLHYIFDIFEVFLFVLPILPNSIYTRFIIIFGYFVGHVCKIQQKYLKLKTHILYDKYRDSNMYI